MKVFSDRKKIDELLTRGVHEIIDFDHLKKRLLAKERLRVKLGIDPTSPFLHLGHAVELLKLRDFQELGHKVVFIVGDFTAQIGDTSDRETERPMLTPKEVEKNMRTYIEQIGKVLDVSKTEIHYNSQWLKKLSFEEIGRQANLFSLAEFISRENIKRRLEKGSRVSLRELLYPLMQAYDSVKIRADVEIGGQDQRFNLLAGRKLQSFYGQKPQDILMTNLISGIDGRKMSKTFNNTINILEKPKDMFAKVMQIKDDLIEEYFIHCTRFPLKEISDNLQQLKLKKINPKDLKMLLAFEITKLFWGPKAAKQAQQFFQLVFQQKKLPPKIKTFNLGRKKILDVLLLTKLVQSKSEAKRLILQGGVKINQKKVSSLEEIVEPGSIVQKGKRHFIKVR